MFNQSLICQQIFDLRLWSREMQLEVVMKISVWEGEVGSKMILLSIIPSLLLPLILDARWESSKGRKISGSCTLLSRAQKGIQIWIGPEWNEKSALIFGKFSVNFDKWQHKQTFSTIRKKTGALWESVVWLVWVILPKLLIYWWKTPDAVDILSVWCEYFHLPGCLISPLVISIIWSLISAPPPEHCAAFYCILMPGGCVPLWSVAAQLHRALFRLKWRVGCRETSLCLRYFQKSSCAPLHLTVTK